MYVKTSVIKEGSGAMVRGRHAKSNRISGKVLVVAVALLFLVTAGVGGTLAFIVDKTDSVQNTFTPATVECEVHEYFNGVRKENVRVENTGNVDAYIRVALVVNWRDANDNIYGKQPVDGIDYTMRLSLNTGGWMKNPDDGYYYLVHPATPGYETAPLIISCEPVASKVPEGCRLSVEVIASAIQAQPISTAETAWGVSISDEGYLEFEGAEVSANV